MTNMTMRETSKSMQMHRVSFGASLASAQAFAGSGMYSIAAQSLAIAIGADAAVHASNGWVLPCTSIVGTQSTESTRCISTKPRTANKPANKRVATWQLRPSGVRETPPG